MQINPTTNVPQAEVNKPEELEASALQAGENASEAKHTRRGFLEAFGAGAATTAGVVTLGPTAMKLGAETVRNLCRKTSFPVLSVPEKLTIEDMEKTLEWLKQPNAVISLFERLRLKKPQENPISDKHNISLGLEDIKKLFEESSNSSLLALWTLIRLRAEHNEKYNRPFSTTVFEEQKENLLIGLLSYLRPECSLIEISNVAHNGKTRSELAMEWLNERKPK